MRLIQARVRCTAGVVDTGWFVPGRETTVVFDSSENGGSNLFQALQALNPVYDISRELPFADHPDVWSQGPHERKVIPKKKTAVFMVFSAEPKHVLELEEIDSELIETDRIEVGRRLDYSRWITFVEISGSTRWSEIAGEMKTLRAGIADRMNLPAAAGEDAFFQELEGTDRLKGAVADSCLRWLKAIEPFVREAEKEVYRECLYKARRAERFAEARNSVAAMLPLTIYLQPGYTLQSSYDFPEIFSAENHRAFHPVESLLRRVCERFSLSENACGQDSALAEGLRGVARSLRIYQEFGFGEITIRCDRQRLHLDGLLLKTRFEQRLSLIAVTCLLAELYQGHRPLLLLDGFERGLPPAETLKMVKWLQRIGSVYQLLAATADEEVAGASGWQSVLRAGSGGLTAARLETA